MSRRNPQWNKKEFNSCNYLRLGRENRDKVLNNHQSLVSVGAIEVYPLAPGILIFLRLMETDSGKVALEFTSKQESCFVRSARIFHWLSAISFRQKNENKISLGAPLSGQD